MVQPQYCKEQREKKMMCFHLFYFSCESEAGPVTQYVKKFVYVISFFLFFLQNVNRVHMCETREFSLMLLLKT